MCTWPLGRLAGCTCPLASGRWRLAADAWLAGIARLGVGPWEAGRPRGTPSRPISYPHLRKTAHSGNPLTTPKHGFPIIPEDFGGTPSRSTIPLTKPSNPTAPPLKTYLFDENTTTHLSIRYRASWDGGYCDPSEISASSELPEISDSSMPAYQQASIPACQHSDYSIQHTDYSIQQASIPAYSIQITAS